MLQYENINKLTNLTDVLVPNNIKQESPRFYELVESFLRNIEDVQSNINSKFLNSIDVEKINNDDIIKIYLDTYVGTLNISDVDNPSALTDLILVSKDLSTRKGTILIYNILLKLLVYLIPYIGSTYATKLEQLKSTTDEVTRKALEEELEELKISNGELGLLNYFNFNADTQLQQEFIPGSLDSENIIPFKYKIESDIEIEIFELYFKPFCHPIGWSVEFASTIQTIFSDKLDMYFRFNLYDCFVLPEVYVGDEVYVSEDGIDNDVEYPLNYYPDAILDTDTNENYEAIISMIVDTSRIIRNGTNIIYKFKNFNTEYPYIKNGVEDTQIARRTTIGNAVNLGELSYSVNPPNDGGMALVGGVYVVNSQISNVNGGIITNNGNNLVTYKQIIDDVKNI